MSVLLSMEWPKKFWCGESNINQSSSLMQTTQRTPRYSPTGTNNSSFTLFLLQKFFYTTQKWRFRVATRHSTSFHNTTFIFQFVSIHVTSCFWQCTYIHTHICMCICKRGKAKRKAETWKMCESKALFSFRLPYFYFISFFSILFVSTRVHDPDPCKQ